MASMSETLTKPLGENLIQQGAGEASFLLSPSSGFHEATEKFVIDNLPLFPDTVCMIAQRVPSEVSGAELNDTNTTLMLDADLLHHQFTWQVVDSSRLSMGRRITSISTRNNPESGQVEKWGSAYVLDEQGRLRRSYDLVSNGYWPIVSELVRREMTG